MQSLHVCIYIVTAHTTAVSILSDRKIEKVMVNVERDVRMSRKCYMDW